MKKQKKDIAFVDCIINETSIQRRLSKDGKRIIIHIDDYSTLYAIVDQGKFSVGRHWDVEGIPPYDVVAFYEAPCANDDDPQLLYNTFVKKIEKSESAIKNGDNWVCPTCGNTLFGGNCQICGQTLNDYAYASPFSS